MSLSPPSAKEAMGGYYYNLCKKETSEKLFNNQSSVWEVE
jgi:hypothetical protein